MSTDEDDRAARALRESLAARAAAYEPVATTVPSRRRRWPAPVGVAAGVAAGAAAVALAVTWVAGQGPPSLGPAATPVPTAEPSPQLPYVDQDGAPLLSCGGLTEPAFSAAATSGVLDPEIDPQDVADALGLLAADQQLRADLPADIDLTDPSTVPWTVLAFPEVDGAPQHLLLGVGSWPPVPGSDPGVVELERTGAAWVPVRTEICAVGPLARPGTGLVRLSPPSQPATTTGTTLGLGVTEESCTSTRDPRPHLTEPYVVETDTTVTVYWGVELEVGAAYRCAGGDPVDAELELASPLGDRVLLDGSVWPPQQVLP